MIAEEARPDDDLDDAYHIIIAIKNKEYLDLNLGFTELEPEINNIGQQSSY